MSNTIVPDRMNIVEFEPYVSHRPVTGYTAGGASTPSRAKPARAGDPGCATQEWSALRPLHDRVLVRRFSAEEVSGGGIVIPEIGREKPLKGTVIAAGPGKKDADGVFRETMVRPGDLVLFSASVNVPYPDIFQDGELVMMAEADILGILTLPESR